MVRFYTVSALYSLDLILFVGNKQLKNVNCKNVLKLIFELFGDGNC